MNDTIQFLAGKLIQFDAEFISDLLRLPDDLKSNFVQMAIPYFGAFADGAEQWGNKISNNSIIFSEQEEKFYKYLRNQHKLFDQSYECMYRKIEDEFNSSDRYFRNRASWLIRGLNLYKNVGVYFCGKHPVGNTILIGLYTPFSPVNNPNGQEIRILFEVLGKLLRQYIEEMKETQIVTHKEKIRIEDYNFFAKCPIGKNPDTNRFCLFSILCTVNYLIYFLDRIFIQETPTKLRWAYLQYYYLIDLLAQINMILDTKYKIDDSLKCRLFRNCMAHYGLQPSLKNFNINNHDIMGGITDHFFGKNYFEVKQFIYCELKSLSCQLENDLIN